MLRVIPSRSQSAAETLLTEAQAGFPGRRSTIDQVLNSRLMIEKPPATPPGKPVVPQLYRLQESVWQSVAWWPKEHQVTI